MNKIHVISLGCPKNLVDSEVMLGILEENGWIIEDEPDEKRCLVDQYLRFYSTGSGGGDRRNS